MPAPSLPPIERSVLQSLAEGRDDIQTAAQLRIPVATVDAIQNRFGPGVDRIRQVLDVRPARPGGFEVFKKAGQAEQDRQQNDPIQQLLAEAASHSQPRIVKKGARIRQLINELRTDLAEEREAERRRQREAEEREAALAEIKKLEEQLAELRRKAGLKPRKHSGGNPASSAASMAALHQKQDEWLRARSVSFSDVLAWAREQGIQSRGSLLAKATKEAWDAAHNQVAAS